MPYVTTKDLKEDVLFRASEKINGSEYAPRVIDYLNRTYKSLCNGASEFLPEYVEDWWWLRGHDVLTLIPALQAGTVTVTQDSAAVTFSSPPVLSTVGYRLRVTNHPEIFAILTHTAGAAAAVLDSPYTGPSGAMSYTLMKVEYPLSVAVASLISPMVGYRGNYKINGMSPERMDTEWPMPQLTTGMPQSFSLEDSRLVRFSHGGRTDGLSMRVEYRYRKMVADLTDDITSIPVVPIEWRHILADMALTHVMLAKNDDRSNAHALSARTALAGMIKENRRRMAKMGANAGMIYPRQTNMGVNWPGRGPLRTESGLIIG